MFLAVESHLSFSRLLLSLILFGTKTPSIFLELILLQKEGAIPNEVREALNEPGAIETWYSLIVH